MIVAGVPIEIVNDYVYEINLLMYIYWLWMSLPLLIAIGFFLDCSFREMTYVINRYGSYKKYWLTLLKKEVLIYFECELIFIVSSIMMFGYSSELVVSIIIFSLYCLTAMCVYTGVSFIVRKSEHVFIAFLVIQLLMIFFDMQTGNRFSWVCFPCWGMANRSSIMIGTSGFSIEIIIAMEIIIIIFSIIAMPKFIKRD